MTAVGDQPTFVLERHPDDPGGLEVRPVGLAEPAGRCGEGLIGVVRLIAVQPVPAGYPLDHRFFLRAVPFVLRALLVGTADGNDPQAALRRDGQIVPSASRWRARVRRK